MRRDRRRAPALNYTGADGCGDLFVYGWSEDRTEALSLHANKEALQLSATPQSFDIQSRQLDIEIEVDVFEQPQRRWPFCTDVSYDGPDNQREKWIAAGGTITIAMSPPGVRRREPRSYRATITLNGVTFVSATGARVTQKQPITFTALVGSGFY